MAAALDAVLIEARISRLVIDCNRALDAPDLIPAVSETTPIPGNARLTEAERSRRIALAYQPFHAAVEAVLAARLAAGRETRVVSVHSFTPVYKRSVRPWQIGILHDEDRRLAKPLIDALSRLAGIVVGVNRALFARRWRLFHAGEPCGGARAALRHDRDPQRRNLGDVRAAEMGGSAHGDFPGP